MPPIPWADIFALILRMIEDCKPEPTPEVANERIIKQIRNPGLLQRLRLERGVRQSMNLTAAQWRKNGDAIMDEIYCDAHDATDDELRELIAQAKAV